MNCQIQQGKAEVLVTPEGDIDLHVAPEFRKVLKGVLAAKPGAIEIDLSRVPFLDSSGIATIVEALKITRQCGGKLRVTHCQDTVRDSLDVAGLTAILCIP